MLDVFFFEFFSMILEAVASGSIFSQHVCFGMLQQGGGCLHVYVFCLSLDNGRSAGLCACTLWMRSFGHCSIGEGCW